jgi:hypothetical protein
MFDELIGRPERSAPDHQADGLGKQRDEWANPLPAYPADQVMRDERAETGADQHTGQQVLAPGDSKPARAR